MPEGRECHIEAAMGEPRRKRIPLTPGMLARVRNPQKLHAYGFSGWARRLRGQSPVVLLGAGALGLGGTALAADQYILARNRRRGAELGKRAADYARLHPQDPWRWSRPGESYRVRLAELPNAPGVRWPILGPRYQREHMRGFVKGLRTPGRVQVYAESLGPYLERYSPKPWPWKLRTDQESPGLGSQHGFRNDPGRLQESPFDIPWRTTDKNSFRDWGGRSDRGQRWNPSMEGRRESYNMLSPMEQQLIDPSESFRWKSDRGRVQTPPADLPEERLPAQPFWRKPYRGLPGRSNPEWQTPSYSTPRPKAGMWFSSKQPTRVYASDDSAFQGWYKGHATRWGLNPNPDDPKQFYDYRAAFRAGVGPNSSGHWPSQFKRAGHPNRYMGGIDTITGKPTSPFRMRMLPRFGTPVSDSGG